MRRVNDFAYNTAKSVLYALRPLRASVFKITHRTEEFTCPLCHYYGPFRAKHADTGVRRHAQCPRCNSLERHRLQFLVMQRLASRFDFSKPRILHVAPEIFIQRHLKKMFAH